MKTAIGWLFLVPILHLGSVNFLFAADAELPDLTNPSRDSSGETNASTLVEFFTAALDYSPQLRIARENMNIGSARRRSANGQLLPQLSASASLSDNRRTTNLTQNYDGERYSLQFSQVLFNWQTFARRKQAYANADQSEAEYYSQLGVLFTDVAERYFNVLQAQDALRSIQSELDAVTNQLNQVESLYDRQLTQITDLYQTQASLAAVEADEVLLQSQLQINQQALNAVTGLTPVDLYELGDTIDIPEVVGNIDYWTQLALENNFEIQAREFALESTRELVSERKGAYLPNVNLIVQQQNTNLGFDNSQIPKADTTYVGVNVSIPLYAGGSNRAAVSEARSLRSIAESELRWAKLDIEQRVRTAHLQIRSSRLRTEAAQTLVESATLAATAMQRGFELGTVTSVDVLNAIRNQYQAERDLQQARYEQIRYLLELKRESGTLVAEDLVEVNNLLVSPE